MDAIVITASINADHRLSVEVDVPSDVPVGAELKVIISEEKKQSSEVINPALLAMREKLRAAVS